MGLLQQQATSTSLPARPNAGSQRPAPHAEPGLERVVRPPDFQPSSSSARPLPAAQTPTSGGTMVSSSTKARTEQISQGGEKMGGDRIAQAIELATLRRQVEIWKDAFFTISDERQLWKTKLDLIEEKLDEITSDLALDDGREVEGAKVVGSGATVESETRSYASAVKKGAFQLLLVDGETLCFSRSLLALGREGGEKAARLTLETLGENRDEGRAQGWKRAEQVLGFGFVDRFELGRFLMSENVLSSWTTLDDFVLGFNAFSTSKVGGVTIVDLPNADCPSKLANYLKFYAGQNQCLRIVLATAEVHRYRRLLATLEDVEVCVMGADQAAETEFGVINAPHLFSEGLSAKRMRLGRLYSPIADHSDEEAYSNNPSRVESAKRAVITPPTHTPSPTKPPTPQPVKELWTVVASKPAKPQPKPQPLTSTTVPKTTSRPGSRRTKSSAGTTPALSSATEGGRTNKTSGTMTLAALAREVAPWAGTRRGLSNEELEAYKVVKNLDPRPCHSQYLSGKPCEQRNSCKHGHDYKLSPAEVVAVGLIAKEICCPSFRWGKCKKTEDECIYSHTCPFGTDCPFGKLCWFPEHSGGKHYGGTPKSGEASTSGSVAGSG